MVSLRPQECLMHGVTADIAEDMLRGDKGFDASKAGKFHEPTGFVWTSKDDDRQGGEDGKSCQRQKGGCESGKPCCRRTPSVARRAVCRQLDDLGSSAGLDVKDGARFWCILKIK